MPMIPFKKMMDVALKNNFAIGYFQSWNQDSLEAVLEAGEESEAPIIIGFGGMPVNQDWFNQWGLSYYAAIGRSAVEKSKIPVSFILNETATYEQCIEGIKLGFNVVMLDSSSLPFEENMEINKKLVRLAHANGVAVEGELGHLPTAGRETPSSLTDPEEAREFVEKTKIDALSVSIGNIHILRKGKANIDLELLKRIRDAAKVPLVIHGGTGFPQDRVKDAIANGVAKFNIGTILKQEYFRGLKSSIEGISDDSDIQIAVGSREKGDFTIEGKGRVKRKVMELIKLYNSSGKASLFKLDR